MIPTATYRLQLHKDFPFASAEAVVPYLHDLGISHLYASPITVARSGSTHGYDVVDPTRVSPELGGEGGLRSLVAALRSRGMGLVIDIVPNHMGVAGGENLWWNDVLKLGQASPFANFFDVDWSQKLLLPILGAPLERVLAEGSISVDTQPAPQLVVYSEHRLPLRPQDHHDLPQAGDPHGLAKLLDRQHYRLDWWRTADDELNWRRFFTISELAGLRIEDPEVFETTHALYFRLYDEGLIDGVRIDHIDGLTDPGGYCRELRRRFDAIDAHCHEPGRRAWIVAEKILGPGEQLATNWGIDGTSGYDFMEQISALLHDPAGEVPLKTLWGEFSGRTGSFAEEQLRARRDMLAWAFESQFQACVDAFHGLARSRTKSAAWTRPMLKRTLQSVLWVFPVYRNYGLDDEVPGHATMMAKVGEAARPFAHPAERDVLDQVLAWLTENSAECTLLAEARRRFQQLSAPIAAKAVEDTAFYRYGPLLSRTDVGFDPETFATSTADFHGANARRAREFPAAMLATATHDHKRGEDVRARLAVLSAVPNEWTSEVRAWDRSADGEDSGVHPADRYMLYQTLYGSWPGRSSDGREFAQRVAAWQEKALREAKMRSSWEAPDTAYEQRCGEFVAGLLDADTSADFVSRLEAFVERTQAAAMANTLVQTALRCLGPGVPDTYQGTELEDLSLVDPDNRRPVDFSLRQELLAQGAGREPKLSLLHHFLTLRRQHPDLFLRGDYRPELARGGKADHIVAFSRNEGPESLFCAVAVRCGRALLDRLSPAPDAAWWEDTVLDVAGRAVSARQLFVSSPVFVDLQS
jgi:(1->4)-alpha-D-glucan 1-alpha-D-glucosylmutase